MKIATASIHVQIFVYITYALQIVAFSIINDFFLFLLRLFGINSTLSDIKIVTSDFIWFAFTWYSFVLPFTFNIQDALFQMSLLYSIELDFALEANLKNFLISQSNPFTFQHNQYIWPQFHYFYIIFLLLFSVILKVFCLGVYLFIFFSFSDIQEGLQFCSLQ